MSGSSDHTINLHPVCNTGHMRTRIPMKINFESSGGNEARPKCAVGLRVSPAHTRDYHPLSPCAQLASAYGIRVVGARESCGASFRLIGVNNANN
jgi:hypothetical protein